MNEKAAAKKDSNRQKRMLANLEVSKSLKNQLTERQKETEQDYLDLADKRWPDIKTKGLKKSD